MKLKVYDLDTAYFNIPIAKGKTIVKVYLKEDVDRQIEKLKDELINNVIWKERFGELFQKEVLSFIDVVLKKVKKNNRIKG